MPHYGSNLTQDATPHFLTHVVKGFMTESRAHLSQIENRFNEAMEPTAISEE